MLIEIEKFLNYFLLQTIISILEGPNCKMKFAYMKIPCKNDIVVVNLFYVLTKILSQLWQSFVGNLKFIDGGDK